MATQAEVDVLAEREKQRKKWGDEHDSAEHGDQELADRATKPAHSRQTQA